MDQLRGPRRAMDGAPRLHLRIPPNARYGRFVREKVTGFGLDHHLSADEIDEFLVAIGEALANAIEHSRSSEPVEVTCELRGDTIYATVSDSGVGFPAEPPQAIELPPEDAERGRGLPIMRRYSDLFAVRTAPGSGTAVMLGRRLRHRDLGGAGAAIGSNAAYRE